MDDNKFASWDDLDMWYGWEGDEAAVWHRLMVIHVGEDPSAFSPDTPPGDKALHGVNYFISQLPGTIGQQRRQFLHEVVSGLPGERQAELLAPLSGPPSATSNSGGQYEPGTGWLTPVVSQNPRAPEFRGRIVLTADQVQAAAEGEQLALSLWPIWETTCAGWSVRVSTPFQWRPRSASEKTLESS